MNAAAALESLGLTLSLAPDGKLALDGLTRLSAEQRDNAVSLAKAHKPAILGELLRRAGVNPWGAHWRSVCPGYPGQCAACPDGNMFHYDGDGKPYALNSQFCKRHDPPQWARERVQGVLQ